MLIGIDASRANKDKKTGTEWYSYYLIRWLPKLDKENQYILYTNKPLRGGLVDLVSDDVNVQGQNFGAEEYSHHDFWCVCESLPARL
ncbi:hypothetical protein [Cylindrospermopsis raciborskii]|uniref:hypothetical protein n=1 Tax=Cylindrospermopsis raciborskii TaxID=77022 RepID=UPI0022C675DC|nr:hypothetical protein [Cylindrospermopsis raciborskii]MCZ2207325.1 hypothetical protein [Cylindrospermopsis raciborskii PAMP2011]